MSERSHGITRSLLGTWAWPSFSLIALSALLDIFLDWKVLPLIYKSRRFETKGAFLRQKK
jgi:hypothetical protein